MVEYRSRNGKLAAIVKTICYFLLFLSLCVGFSFFKPFFPIGWEKASDIISGTLAAVISSVVFLRIEKAKRVDYWLAADKFTVLRFLAGFVIGVLLTGFVFYLFFTVGNISLEVNADADLLSFFLLTLPLLPLAFMEELAFRSYPLIKLSNTFGWQAGLAITSIMFAIYHIAMGWGIAQSFLGPGIWGVVFGTAALYSRGIALPAGMHLAGNMVQAGIGMKSDYPSLWKLSETNARDAQFLEWAGISIHAGLLAVAILVAWLSGKKLSRK